MRLVKQFGTVAVIAFVGRLVLGAVGGSWVLTLALGLATAALALLGYAWVVRRTEHREATEVGRPGAWSAVVRGLGIGALMFVAVIGSIALTGGYTIEGWGSVGVAAALAGVTAAAAVTEELLFRGIVFRILEERTGTVVALLLTSVLFGAMHLANPKATIWGAVAIAVEAGGMLGAAYVATRTLWLPIGIHFGWNFAAAGIFGTVVSGNVTPQGLLLGATSGPALLSGGAFGPEGSLFAVLAGVLLTAGFLRLAHRRGRLVPMRRRASQSASTVTV
ncbi:CPBP family intramembrane glutamic endopeptidase [Cellulomonas sp. URHE0023]|uniref:CPBP family intramembrane glutamic endopeptidase n=1 Tax=Cellulomonas sp. URHE0023 TaxID=1380354 RepID=UPI0004841739|nr:CPBP family intramembrane glutamic endopeptidase [Cellulomonas sp. URHE0023]